MPVLRNVIKLLANRWRAWIGFEVLFRLVVLLLVNPCIKFSVDISMTLSGYSYLTWENIFGFITTPACIVMVLIWSVLATLVALFELASLHYIFTVDELCGSPKIRDAAYYACSKMPGFLKPANVAAIPYFLLLLPLVNLGPVAGIAQSISLPEFIMEYVEMNPVLSVLYLAVILGLFAVIALRVFCMVFFVSEDMPFLKSTKKAREVGKGHVVHDVLRIVLIPTVVLIVVGLLLSLLGLPALLGGASFAWWNALIRIISTLVGTFLTVPVTYATCIVLLLRREDVELAKIEAPLASNSRKIVRIALACVTIGSILGGSYFIAVSYVIPAQNIGQLDSKAATLTAHRGGVFGAPENTMAAFKQAKIDGADVCEIDVQQTSDGVIFVSHDTNFSRISGVDKDVWDLTWQEISQLDATGEQWEGKVEKQHYPKLEEVIAWAKDAGMELNIELKPTGHEVDFEKSVVDVVKAADFVDKCIFTSQDYATVERIDEYAPECKTTYVMTLAYGRVYELEAADVFSVEENSATPELVGTLHEHGKEVLAWVVNSEASIQRALDNGVDSVITDEVSLAREVIDEKNELTPAEDLINGLFAIFS